VRVHDQYQAFFPPDVTFVADHAKRAVTSYPIARESYYGVDYRPGTDITWYKNIPVPTSYMVTKSKYDFSGGYDHALRAGLIHTSNRHLAPGKKLWTWGNAEFGYAWDRNLTDEDGPYIELMAGAFTDNQPDFSWLQPYETKKVSQYWYPIQQIGPVKNANTEAAVNLELKLNEAFVGVCVTALRTVRVKLACKRAVVFEEQLELEPGKPFTKTIGANGTKPTDYRLTVLDADGKELIAYQPEERMDDELGVPATEPLPPEEIVSIDELYLTGLHLEQYRHATRLPETYWCEGLKRDPEDSRMNNAMGLTHLRKGQFVEAEKYFARAVRRLILRNPNPRDGEAFYNLGLARMYQDNRSGAYDAFHKSVWNYAWQSPGYYALASISTESGDLCLALEQVEQSLLTNVNHLQARALKASLLRKSGRVEEAKDAINEIMALDRLDFRTIAERYLLSRNQLDLHVFITALEGDVQTLLDVGYDLAWSGLREDAYTLLNACGKEALWEHPMFWFTLAWLASSLGQKDESDQYTVKAETAPSQYCFPARLEEMIVLENAVRRNPSGAKAFYYLGNLYYDKRRYEEAIGCWRRSVELEGKFSIPWRNLGIAEFNVLRNPEAAELMFTRSFAINSKDARVLYEWDQLKKRARLAPPQERLRALEQHRELVAHRDDLTLEYITLLHQCGKAEVALESLNARRFSPWEGGEGLVSGQYVQIHLSLGREALAAANPADALRHFEAARSYPDNLGEGKHLLTLERDLDYFSGLAAVQLGDMKLAYSYWLAASAPLTTLGIHSYFQSLSLLALGNHDEGQAILSRLAEFAARQMVAEPKIDYFATSLPDLLLFDDDLRERNRIESLLLSGLVSHGRGDVRNAVSQLGQVVAADPNHIFAAGMLEWIKLSSNEAHESSEERFA
jgi:tetratricopeptide (TPR) repeat protein